MPCPCHPDKINKGCRLCFLYYSSATYRTLLDGGVHDGKIPPKGYKPLTRLEKCIYLGKSVEVVNNLGSKRCGKWYVCDIGMGINQKCRPNTECQTCESYDPDGSL